MLNALELNYNGFMFNWQNVVELINSTYRDDYYTKVTCERLLRLTEQSNNSDNIAIKFEFYLSNSEPVDALVKACYEYNIQ